MIGVMVPSVFAEAPPPFERTIITQDTHYQITGCNLYQHPATYTTSSFALSNDNSILIPSTHGVICKISPNGDFTLLDFTNVLDDGCTFPTPHCSVGAFHLDSNDNLFFAYEGGSVDCKNCVHKSTLDGLLLLSFPAEDNLGNPIGFTGFLESIEEITTDPAGNIYVLRNHPHHDPVGFSIFKYNRAGIYVDQITLPPSIHAVSNITFDSLGNFYFIAKPSFWHGPLGDSSNTNAQRWENVPDIDTFQLNKMSPDGNVTTLIESESGYFPHFTEQEGGWAPLFCVKDIEIDSIGNIYLATCPGRIDISTSKFDSNGVLLFRFESNPKSEYEDIAGIEIGSDGKLYALQQPLNRDWNIQLFRGKFVEDNVPPIINPVENIIAEATSSSGATVRFSPTANDAIDGSMPVDCTPNSGSIFPFGTTEITCTSTDYSFNTSYLIFEVNVTNTPTPTPVFDEQSQQLTDAEQRISELEAELEAERGGGCLIATAAFGSEMAPQVQFLREIRDNTVLQTESGSAFMTGFNQFYYSFSPAVADYERENPVFKEAVKLTLTPLLTSLTLLQYTDIDSESVMLGYGIGVILLNIGMYFVAPVVVIMTVRKRI